MHYMKFVLNIRLVALLAVAVAVLLAASSLASPRQASAANPADFDLALVGGNVLFCMDIFYDIAPLIPDPATHTTGSDGSDYRAAKIMVRFDPHPTQADAWFVTSEALNNPDFPPTADMATAACPAKGDNNPAPPSDESPSNPTVSVPIAKFNKAAGEVVWTNQCDLFDIGPGLYVLTEFTIFVDGDSGNPGFGRNRARVGIDPEVCNDSTGDLIYSAMEVTNRTATEGAPDDTPGVNDNWDGDGCTDWDELSPKGARGSNNVFSSDCPGVGGVAELAEAAGTPLAAPDSSGGNTGLIAGIVAAIAAGAVTLGGAAWYTRRRTIQ